MGRARAALFLLAAARRGLSWMTPTDAASVPHAHRLDGSDASDVDAPIAVTRTVQLRSRPKAAAANVVTLMLSMTAAAVIVYLSTSCYWAISGAWSTRQRMLARTNHKRVTFDCGATKGSNDGYGQGYDEDSVSDTREDQKQSSRQHPHPPCLSSPLKTVAGKKRFALKAEENSHGPREESRFTGERSSGSHEAWPSLLERLRALPLEPSQALQISSRLAVIEHSRTRAEEWGKGTGAMSPMHPSMGVRAARESGKLQPPASLEGRKHLHLRGAPAATKCQILRAPGVREADVCFCGKQSIVNVDPEGHEAQAAVEGFVDHSDAALCCISCSPQEAHGQNIHAHRRWGQHSGTGEDEKGSRMNSKMASVLRRHRSFADGADMSFCASCTRSENFHGVQHIPAHGPLGQHSETGRDMKGMNSNRGSVLRRPRSFAGCADTSDCASYTQSAKVHGLLVRGAFDSGDKDDKSRYTSDNWPKGHDKRLPGGKGKEGENNGRAKIVRGILRKCLFGASGPPTTRDRRDGPKRNKLLSMMSALLGCGGSKFETFWGAPQSTRGGREYARGQPRRDRTSGTPGQQRQHVPDFPDELEMKYSRECGYGDGGVGHLYDTPHDSINVPHDHPGKHGGKRHDGLPSASSGTCVNEDQDPLRIHEMGDFAPYQITDLGKAYAVPDPRKKRNPVSRRESSFQKRAQSHVHNSGAQHEYDTVTEPYGSDSQPSGLGDSVAITGARPKYHNLPFARIFCHDKTGQHRAEADRGQRSSPSHGSGTEGGRRFPRSHSVGEHLSHGSTPSTRPPVPRRPLPGRPRMHSSGSEFVSSASKGGSLASSPPNVNKRGDEGLASLGTGCEEPSASSAGFERLLAKFECGSGVSGASHKPGPLPRRARSSETALRSVGAWKRGPDGKWAPSNSSGCHVDYKQH